MASVSFCFVSRCERSSPTKWFSDRMSCDYFGYRKAVRTFFSFLHSCSDGVIFKRHRVQRQSVTVRRRDRIPCIQACHPSEFALRIHFTCCIFLSVELRVQRLAREPPSLLDLSRDLLHEIALPSIPTIFPVARSISLTQYLVSSQPVAIGV